MYLECFLVYHMSLIYAYTESINYLYACLIQEVQCFSLKACYNQIRVHHVLNVLKNLLSNQEAGFKYRSLNNYLNWVEGGGDPYLLPDMHSSFLSSTAS